MPPAPPFYRLIDPLDLPRIGPDQVRSGGADGVMLEAGEAPRRFLRMAPEYHDDPNGAHLFAGFVDQPVEYPPAFVTSSRNSALVGYRMTLADDGACFTDEALPVDARAAYLRRLAEPDDFANEQTGLRATNRAGRFRLVPGDRARERLDGTVVVLCSGEPTNFGSFLFRVLPKLHAVRALGLRDKPLLLPAGSRSMLHFLSLLDIGLDRVRLHDARRIYAIDHAIRPCLRNPHAYLDDETRALFAGLRERHGTAGATRIYVSRLGHAGRGASSRVMLNEAALIERLRSLGFLIVEPETLSAREQIEVFSSATMVVGPSGSAMFNTVFCRPGTRVIDIESEPHWIHAHTCLFASLGLRAAIFEGDVDGADLASVHRRWTVDIDALCERIAQFPAERAAPAGVPPVARRSGTLDGVTPVAASGWAKDAASDTPAIVEILLDGRPIGRARADLPRSDLEAMGACAFLFHFPASLAPLPAGSVVAARFADAGADLVHSPRCVA